MRTLLLLTFPVLLTQEATAQTPTQVTVRDDAKVGLIVTGTGNTINTTQIFGKSPEYAELKKRLDGLAAAIAKKANRCGQYTDPVAKDDCRTELIALNAERDSVQKIETRFREDVIRLAESFSKMELNSERLRLAKALFDEGKIREADHVLNAREMKQEGDALLAKKEREQKALHETDSLLRVKADEFALKAMLKATDYRDSLRYDSAEMHFGESLRYCESMENLWSFALLLNRDNRSDLAIPYYERALKCARSERAGASLALNLGIAYSNVQRMTEAETMYLRSLEIRERLAKTNPVQFEPDLAATTMGLGNFYRAAKRVPEAETMYRRSLEIRERSAKNNPTQFEPDLATTYLNLGSFYRNLRRMPEAKTMYDRSLEIRERLAKTNPAQFEPGLSATCLNLGNFYFEVEQMPKAETMYRRSLEIRERLAQISPAHFEPDLGNTAMNFGNFYYTLRRMSEAETMYRRSLEIYERLAKTNPAQFEPELAYVLGNVSSFYLFIKKFEEAQAAAERALALAPAENWVRSNLGHSHLLRNDWPQAKTIYEAYLKNEPDPAAAKKTLAKDWDDLEAAGVSSPAVAMARKWAKE